MATSASEIRSGRFSFPVPVKETEENIISWKSEHGDRKVTYLLRSKMGVWQKLKGLDKELWMEVGRGDHKVYLKREDVNKLTNEEMAELKTFFETTFRSALKLAKKLKLEVPQLGPSVVVREAEKVRTLIQGRLGELVAAAQSSPMKSSKLIIPGKVARIRCEIEESTGKAILSTATKAGKGSYKTGLKMVDFGSAERIVVDNKVYAYVKLHGLKKFNPEEVQERVQMLRQEAESVQFFQEKGVRNITKLYKVKTVPREVEGKTTSIPVGMMVEWCNLGDSEWITAAPPQKGTKEYSDCLRMAYDAAVGLADIHAQGRVHGDFKPANVFLVSCDGKIGARLGDFGGSVEIGSELKTLSPLYSAPENNIRWKGQYSASKEAEAWSFGISLLEWFHGAKGHAFETISNEERSSIKSWEAATAKVKADLDTTDPLDKLILDCLEVRKRQARISLEEICNRLQAMLPGEKPKKGGVSHKAQAQHIAQEEQRLIDWKTRATESAHQP